MTEISGQGGLRAGATAVVTEAYAFACMRCGYGWEQSYEIEHHVDGDGRTFVLYVADGRIVPSPLNRPTCHSCDGHLVRILRPGRVDSARDAAHRERRVPAAGPVEAPWTPAGPAPLPLDTPEGPAPLP
ncbi:MULTISPECIES: hypothetical protein [Streptomyces]|uniref:C2H2-type domain-containing protein n=1 Tax=Streptomyces tendae TaxID=1932 RepID=A0ABX5ZYE7_STRTE|nr:hypothetical protein [Streptomyces tendae]QER89370.1 hypothetical protein F3L20_29005 [Streptomyces tendae]